MARKKSKTATAAMTEDERAMIENAAWAQARAEFEQESKPNREREEFEHFKRAVRSDNPATISGVIFQALTRGNVRADIALRDYIAELVDSGQDDKLGLQLRFYLVQYLVHPLIRPLQHWVQE